MRNPHASGGAYYPRAKDSPTNPTRERGDEIPRSRFGLVKKRSILHRNAAVVMEADGDIVEQPVMEDERLLMNANRRAAARQGEADLHRAARFGIHYHDFVMSRRRVKRTGE